MEANGDMLNLVDDELPPLANGHGQPPAGPTEAAVDDPMAELMGLTLGEPPTADAGPRPSQGISKSMLYLAFPLHNLCACLSCSRITSTFASTSIVG